MNKPHAKAQGKPAQGQAKQPAAPVVSTTCG